MNKKRIERSILALVYEESEYVDILASEEPDFRITRHHRGDCFGVEVTTFHYSESYARLRNIPDYFDEIVGEARYRHRNDKQELEVHEVVIQDAEGNEKSKTKCLIRPRPKIQDHVAMINQVLHKKDNKLPQYQNDLAHINLIVFDAEAGFLMSEEDEYYQNLIAQDLREQLYRSGFREIFLVTMLADRWVYIPLKMNLLIGDWYMFHSLIHTYFPEQLREHKYEDEFQIFFAQYLQHKTGKAFYRRHEGYKVEVIWANSGIMQNRPSNSIFDHADYPLPVEAVTPDLNRVSRFFSSKTFRSKLNELLQKETFITKLVFDVRGPVDFLPGKMKSVIAREIPKDP